MKARTALRVLVAAVALTVTAGAAPAASASAPAASATPAAGYLDRCTGRPDGWFKVSSAIGDSTSPWYGSAPGIDFRREIQFRALGGVIGQRCLAGRSVGPETPFMWANTYRMRFCQSLIACRYGDWTSYSEAQRQPGDSFRFPNLNSGYDPFYGIYRLWPMGS